MEIQNITRRSFMKKTTALAVGISATTLFSGLAHAAGGKVSGCTKGRFVLGGGCSGDAAPYECTIYTCGSKVVENATAYCDEKYGWTDTGPATCNTI